MTFRPAYLELLRSGELERRAEAALAQLEHCDLCARRCGIDRTRSPERAACSTGRRAFVASAAPHFGEEEPLVGTGGSGTIFFSWCNLECCFCQNFDISQLGDGHPVDDADLAALMLELQARGCHNVNLVSPSHVVAQILAALVIAAQQGLTLPVVYNSGGYDLPSTLGLLDGVVDIYMPDMKYADPKTGRAYSDVADYPAVNRAAVIEMHRQVGDLVCDEHGIARRGLLVRHLVLPGDLAGTAEVVEFLSSEVSSGTYINVMGQYRPCHHAADHPELDRGITRQELAAAKRLAEDAGLRLDRRKQRFRGIET